MDVGQILIGAAAVLIILYIVGRRSSPTPISRTRTLDRPRAGRQPLTRLEDVVPIPAPAGWPVLPPEPAGLDGLPEARARVELADGRTTGQPARHALWNSTRCRRRRSDARAAATRSMCEAVRTIDATCSTASELETFQDRWAVDASARYEESRVLQASALAEWHRRLAEAGIAVGPQDLDVVGESFYHAALAGIRSVLHQGKPGFEVRAVGLLRREPDNPHDGNAIGVYVHGTKVGHLDRYDAEEYQPLLKRSGGQLWVQAVLMGGRMTPVGEVGPIGVKLDDIPEPGG